MLYSGGNSIRSRISLRHTAASPATYLRTYLGCLLGVTTNVAYLIAILDHPVFRAGATHTGFIPEHMAEWAPERAENEKIALIATALEEYSRRDSGGTVAAATAGSRSAVSPWMQLGRFRLHGLD